MAFPYHDKLALRRAGGASLSRGRAYNTPKLLSILQRDRGRKRERERERESVCEREKKRERDERRESRWRGTRELTAFITAFSPCHGLSLRHSLPAIERQAICLPFAPSPRVIQARLAIRLQLAARCGARTSDWICACPVNELSDDKRGKLRSLVRPPPPPLPSPPLSPSLSLLLSVSLSHRSFRR